jgi:hypothetical protein
MKHFLTLALLLISIFFNRGAYAQSDPWDGLENKGARYAGTKDARDNAVIFVCPVTGAPQLIVRSHQFRVSVPDDHRYTLTFATDRGRNEVTAVAKDGELTFEANDINAQLTYQRLAEDIAASKAFSINMSPFGWKGQFTAEGAAAALKPMLAGCRE